MSKSNLSNFNFQIDLSKTKLHPREVSGGVQIACTYRFDNSTKTGLKKRMTGFGATEELARQKLEDNIKLEQAKIYYGDKLSSGEMTVQKAIETFIEEEKSGEFISPKTKKPKTEVSTEHDIENAKALLYPYTPLMKCPLNKVTHPILKQWKLWVDKKTYKKGKVNYLYSDDKKKKVYTILHRVLSKYCENLGIPNPMAEISNWSTLSKKKTEDDILIAPEIKKFLTYCTEDLSDHNRAQAAVQILVYIRIGELLGLKVGDFDEEQGTLKIQRKLIRHTDGHLELSTEGYGKNDYSLRTISLSRPAIAILSTICKEKKPSDMIFLTSRGNLVNARNYSTWFHNTMKKLDIRKDIPAYNLRASGISLAVNAGCSVQGVQLNAGHASTKTTLTYYTAIYSEKKQQAADQLSDVVDELLSVDGKCLEVKNDEES